MLWQLVGNLLNIYPQGKTQLAPQRGMAWGKFLKILSKHQKGHRRLSVFRLGALTGSLLTLLNLADNLHFVTSLRKD